MGFFGRRPLRNCPEAIHQAPGAVGEFVSKPPLFAERGVSFARKTLKVSHPIKRAKCLFFVTLISGSLKVQRLDGREACRVAVATLVRFVAAEIHTVALLGSYGRSVNAILRPFGSRFHPLHQLPGVRLPVSVLLRM